MRRTLTLLALLGVAAFWMGCSSTSSPNPEGANSTGAYNSSPSGPSPVIGNTSNTKSSSSAPPVGAPPPGGGNSTGIKPPMKNDNK